MDKSKVNQQANLTALSCYPGRNTTKGGKCQNISRANKLSVIFSDKVHKMVEKFSHFAIVIDLALLLSKYCKEENIPFVFPSIS